MDNIFGQHNKYRLVYVDDIIIFNENKKKMELEQERINFLGIIIDKGQVIVQSHVLEKMQGFPDKLHDKVQVQRFLGCINYTTFIAKVAQLTQSLTLKTKENNKWQFSQEDMEIVKKL